MGKRAKRCVIWTSLALVVAVAGAAAAGLMPAVSTGAANSVTQVSAVLTGSVNPEGQATSYYFEYGPNTAYGTRTASGDAGSVTSSVSVSAPIGSLAPNTTYHYRLVATNASGTTVGGDRSFKTSNVPIPRVTTGSAHAVTATAATLTGSVNPESQATSYYFVYGLTDAYGSATAMASAGSGGASVSVSMPIGSLQPNTTYHYRLIAANGSGTARGSDRSFKTARASSGITITASRDPITYGQSLSVVGRVQTPGASHTTVVLQKAPSFAGPFTNVATTVSAGNGDYSFAFLAPRANTYYRALANGTSSATTFVGVRFWISLATAKSGGLVRFGGRAAPTNNRLFVLIERLGADGHWHGIAHARLRGSGSYSIRVLLHRGGLYRTAVGGDATHERGFSRMVRIHVP